jgi:hypothetical protein
VHHLFDSIVSKDENGRIQYYMKGYRETAAHLQERRCHPQPAAAGPAHCLMHLPLFCQHNVPVPTGLSSRLYLLSLDDVSVCRELLDMPSAKMLNGSLLCASPPARLTLTRLFFNRGGRLATGESFFHRN